MCTLHQFLMLLSAYISSKLCMKSTDKFMGIISHIAQGCGVGVGRNFRWSRSRKEFLCGAGVGKNVLTPNPTSV
jgi:hypothetical protein